MAAQLGELLPSLRTTTLGVAIMHTTTTRAPGSRDEPTEPSGQRAMVSAAERDLDDVSVASSADLDYGPDHLYEVEALHAEKHLRDGRKKYLIEWTDFAVKDWSWEPAEEINDTLKGEWERTKHEMAAGLRPPQKEVIARWRQAKAAEVDRRERKNAKRMRLGLEPVPYQDFATSESEVSESEAEAGEPLRSPSRSTSASGDHATQLGPGRQENRPPQTKALVASRGNQRSFTSTPTSQPSVPAPNLPASSSSTDPAAAGKTAAASGVKSATGYQGTARPVGSKTAVRPAAPQRAASAKAAPDRKARKSARPIIRNVFIDGKKRKPRRKTTGDLPPYVPLEQQPTSSSRTRLYNLSTKRKVELKARDMENANPGLSLQNVVFSTLDDPAVLRASTLAETTTPGTISLPAASEKAASRNGASFSTEKKQAEAHAAPDAQPAKKRKSVHFADGESLQATLDTAMELDIPIAPLDKGGSVDCGEDGDEDDNDTMPMDLESPLDSPEKQATRRPSLSDYQVARFSTRDVKKKAVFGSGAGTSLEVCFKDIPNDRPWLPDFLSEQSVHFSHTCLAEAFIARQSLRCDREPFLHGNLTSPAAQGEEALANVASRLKMTGSGIVFCRPGYNILVYPSKLDDWEFPELKGAASLAAKSEDGSLKYHVFISLVDISAFLNWNPQPLPSGRSDRHLIMETVFGISEMLYDRLVAPKQKDARVSKHLFYLLFPPSKGPYVFQLMLWLRECDPDAQIYVPLQEGSWNAFLRKASGEQNSAVLVVHESAMCMVRQIPSLVSFLKNSRDHLVWLWPDKGRVPPALMPSVAGLPGKARGHFDIQPVRLFPHNHVFLLTPSFYIAEPAHALELVAKLPQSNSNTTRARKLLMVPRNIVGFLEHVAAKHRDSQFRYELVFAMLATIGPRLAAVPEQSCASPVLFVDEGIDARDEQSLVNWFGAWSIAHADQYRKFHVIGTSHSSRPAECLLRIPRYRPGTIGDPDALRRTQEEAERGTQLESQPPPHHAAPAEAVPPVGKARLAPTVFQSQILPSDDYQILAKFLMGLQKTDGRTRGPWRLYGYPVFHEDTMAPDFVPHQRNATIPRWFTYTWPFNMQYRLYSSLFYTIEDDHGPHTAPRGSRRPWLVFYRSKKREQTELVIIDPGAKDRFHGVARPSLSDLCTAQQAVVKHVATRAKEKTSEDWGRRPQSLCQVWIRDVPTCAGTGSDLDRCLRFLQLTIDDWDNIPLSDDELFERGFKPVDAPGCDRPKTPPPEPGDDDGKYAVLFHPPVAYRPPKGASKCKNHMFEAALEVTRQAKALAARPGEIEYRYIPTTEWYAEQQTEGRDFTNIGVGDWERFLSLRVMSRVSRKSSDAQKGENRPSSRE